MINGKIIVTTQPADQASEMIDLLHKEGAVVFNLPMIKTQTLFLDAEEVKESIEPDNYDIIIFTSRKGVKGFFENVYQTTGSYKISPEIEIAVVGPATAEELKHYNQNAHWVNPGNDAKTLAAYLLEGIVKPRQKVLLALGNRAPDFLQKTLSGIATVDRINVYETLDVTNHNPEIARHIAMKTADMCIFTSPSGFFAFLNSFTDIKGLNLAAIGETTASAITENGYAVAAIAAQPSVQHMVTAVKEFFSQQKK